MNNSLAFPGVFRGALDVRARAISDGMALAAARALAACARRAGLAEDRLLPGMGGEDAHVQVAVATARAAVAEGLAQRTLSPAEMESAAIGHIREARALLDALVRAGVVKLPPD